MTTSFIWHTDADYIASYTTTPVDNTQITGNRYVIIYHTIDNTNSRDLDIQGETGRKRKSLQTSPVVSKDNRLKDYRRKKSKVTTATRRRERKVCTLDYSRKHYDLKLNI